jgi:ornithine cyclodeaminase
VRFLDAHAVSRLGYAAAIGAVRRALQDGLDPARNPPRAAVGLAHGEFLLMPAESAAAAGVKVVTVAPGNPARGRPRVQAAYLLFDSETLGLRAVLDGTALTTLRTPAVSVAAVLDRLPERPLRLTVIGAGPQAVGHVEALRAVRPIAHASHLVRDPTRAAVPAVALGSDDARRELARADVVVCATSARSPLFDSTIVADGAVVVAVGSHEPDARELDAALLARATVVVEDVPTALREAGDVVLAIADGALARTELLAMRDVLTGAVRLPADRPLVFKSVGMSWQDLVVAAAVVGRSGG